MEASLYQGVYGQAVSVDQTPGSPAARTALTLENVQELELQTSYGAGEDPDDQRSTSVTSDSLPSERDSDVDSDVLSDNEWEDIRSEAGAQSYDGESAHQIASRIRSNIRHSPIRVPRYVNPFDGDEERESRFWAKVATLAAMRPEVEPENWNLLPHEFEDGIYPASHEIPLGHSRTRTQTIPLPIEIWRPRAVAWVQAMHVLTHELALDT